MVASESVALEGTGHAFERDVAPGEAVFIDLAGHRCTREQCADNADAATRASSSTSTWRGPTR